MDLPSRDKQSAKPRKPFAAPPHIPGVEQIKVTLREARYGDVPHGKANTKQTTDARRGYIFDNMIFGKALVCRPDTIDPWEVKQ